MSKYALIKNNEVINTIIWDGTLGDLIIWGGDSFDDYVNIDDIYCGIGFIYDGSKFSDPNAPPPPTNAELRKSDLLTLSSVYQDDIEKLNRAWLAAAVNDGVNETTKKDAVLAQINTRKTQYASDRAAIIAQYP
ncbi:hypothetical protein SIO53_004531 [Enterobacter roggenkampii]|uniref:hypothetical protein n=1 Tax=Enterobacter roggenkampii TaxID=1812935 RepID=UPI0003BF3A49|nr:hypothetical protein [Enterobacter roggenkampii]EKY4004883.1 hypothetical protein [Enterobacter roggenkampii]ELW9297058.1 hypothetical protein [Enterobacter roggenkampii]ESM82051.1 hypothetical protein L380_03982 [Enterobacter roggenkampii MGH 34]OUR35590.1 hypothetical protein B9J96_13715 [Enterobacter roggenkampii]